MAKNPRLRTVDKYLAPYRLNELPREFAVGLGYEMIYILATRPSPTIEGGDWEQIFARLIQARWKPSNVGLDDVVLEQTAWSAKTVKASNPHSAKKVRLISGRNSLAYSFDRDSVKTADPTELGEEILSIWNARVSGIRSKYENLRTIVLIKSDDLVECSVFEVETELYQANQYSWHWNQNGNLEGHTNESTPQHRFTWQPHGAQFTIIHEVPERRIRIRVRRPDLISRDTLLQTLQVNEQWVEIL